MRSAIGTRHKPVARIPDALEKCEPRETGRGAEKLATPNAQGIHPLPLLGPSFEQGWAEEAADEQLTWVEGSVGGAIREIKCRLCPDIREDFKRPCGTMEAHPLIISFCDDCGDFFARGDSLERHRRNLPAKCFNVTPKKADVKRRVTEKVNFRAGLEGSFENR